MFTKFSIGYDCKKDIVKGKVLIRGHECFPWYENVSEERMMKANALGFGAFGWLNQFHENVRKKENLKQVVWWYADVDGLSTREEKAYFLSVKLARVHLLPTKIIESKNGFHIYWKASHLEKADPDLFERIVRGINQKLRIESVFDCTRVLRVPDTIHSKNPDDRFHVKTMTTNMNHIYTATEMLECFPYVPHTPQKIGFSNNKKDFGNDFFSELEKKNQGEYLQKLSGSHLVNNEVYDFQKTSRGHHNILVNGEMTGAFLDENGMLGSHGQPVYTIAQWLKNTGNFQDWKEIINTIKSL